MYICFYVTENTTFLFADFTTLLFSGYDKNNSVLCARIFRRKIKTALRSKLQNHFNGKLLKFYLFFTTVLCSPLALFRTAFQFRYFIYSSDWALAKKYSFVIFDGVVALRELLKQQLVKKWLCILTQPFLKLIRVFFLKLSFTNY